MGCQPIEFSGVRRGCGCGDLAVVGHFGCRVHPRSAERWVTFGGVPPSHPTWAPPYVLLVWPKDEVFATRIFLSTGVEITLSFANESCLWFSRLQASPSVGRSPSAEVRAENSTADRLARLP